MGSRSHVHPARNGDAAQPKRPSAERVAGADSRAIKAIGSHGCSDAVAPDVDLANVDRTDAGVIIVPSLMLI
jgi:hypothetical protein